MNVILRVSGLVPVRIKLREDYHFQLTDRDGTLVKVTFEDWQVPPRANGSYGEGVDDRRGTYVKSMAILDFVLEVQTLEELSSIDRGAYLHRALRLLNRLIEVYRHLTRDHHVAKLPYFETFDIKVLDENGGIIPGVIWDHVEHLGPAGVSLMGHLGTDIHHEIQEFLRSGWNVPLSRALLLDALNHLDRYDLAHAVFDIATALEVHIDAFVERHQPEKAGKPLYTQYDEVLREITGSSLDDVPELFMALEYIRAIRNNIAHRAECKFTTESLKKSKYLQRHELMEGHVVDSPQEVRQLHMLATSILDFVDDLEAFPAA